MYSIYRKELSHYFSSLIAYIVLGIFFLFMGMTLFIFPNSSVLHNNYASLEVFFTTAPIIFTFVIPAITMHLFSEERQNGTIEMLMTKPIPAWSILAGKYLSSLTLVLFALVPTIIYYITVYQLGLPSGNIDSGAMFGSYIGLLLLAAAFVAIGIFASSLSSSQVISFVIATFICFLLHWGFESISFLPDFFGLYDDLIQRLGMNYHYKSLSRGLIDSRDVLYFLSVAFLFLTLSFYSLKKTSK